MKPKKLHITILSLLIWSFSFAQQYTNYSTKEGLPSDHVYTIVQDAKGFMWFLTDKGMVKYNGKTFKTFTTKEGLPNNDVWDAFTTPDDKVWYFSKSSSLGYIENDSVFSFSNENKNENINPIFSIQIKDSVYPAGPRKIFKLKNKTWKSEKMPKNKGESFSKVYNKNVGFIGTPDHFNSIKIYGKDEKFLNQIPFKHKDYFSGSRGQVTDSLFFWASKSGYSILNLNTLKLKSIHYKDEIGIETIKFPRINLVGDQLQITGDRFVGVLDTNFHITKPFIFPEHLNAHFGFIDSQNTIWLSTFTNGIYKLPAIKQHVTYHFKDQKILKLDYVKDDLFLGIYNKGFYKYNISTKSFKSYIKYKVYPFGVTNIKALNTTFFLTDNSLIKEQKNKREITNYLENKNGNKIDGFVKKIIFFNSQLYGINAFGIFRLHKDNLNIEKEITLRGSTDFLEYNSRLIIATNNGLKELKNDKVVEVNSLFSSFNKSILSINKLPNNKLLLNTDGYGSFITDLTTITPLKQSEFLIVQDAFVKDKEIWLATNTGVLHFEKENSTYNFIRNYTINDGLPNNNVNTLFANESDLIVGTNNGLVTIPISNDKQDLLMDVFIEKASYSDKLIKDNNNSFSYKNDANTVLKFDINAIDFSENTTTSFSYKLEPIQKEWTTTSTNEVNFNNIAPNNYVFHLKSGTINKQLEFSIQPLWWQTIWAKLLMGLFSIVIISLVAWKLSRKLQEKRNRKLVEEKRISDIQLKALRSQMNPHFVFNSLAAIQYYINNNEIKASETYLVKFSKLIRQFFELSKETEISLSEEVKLIKNYLDIEKLRFKDKFEYQIHIDPKLNLSSAKLPTMLLQPIVENAVNHGVFNKLESGNITVNFSSKNNKSLKVEIIDDGVGYVNTKNKSKRKVKSSNVLEDRLRFLNQTELWKISYAKKELHPELDDKGNIATFIITQL